MSYPHALDAAFAKSVEEGLTNFPKVLKSRYLYDDTGTRLFQKIMQLDEYYLTRSEDSLLRKHALAIAERWAMQPLDVVELGAGDGTKTLHLLKAFREKEVEARYLPIDISMQALQDVQRNVLEVLPDMPIVPMHGDWNTGLAELSASDRPKLVLFLGSNIGNLLTAQANSLLASVAGTLTAGYHLLIGFDLVKDPKILLPAYSDREGVTAAFNLNLLKRINRELGGDFDLAAFQHHALYNPVSQAMESFLLSRKAQQVRVETLGLEVAFEPWEPVHLEYSHKFSWRRIEELAEVAGMRVSEKYLDEQGWFADVLFVV